MALWGIASRRRRPRSDPLRACFILWGGWLVTFFAVFSTVTTLWPYYAAALAAGLAAVSLAPAVASVNLAAHGQSAFDTPFESARTQEAVALGAGKQAAVAVQSEIPYWQDAEGGARYLMAAQSAALPSLVIYDTGLEALPIGGFDGTTPSPTLAQLQADIRHGLFHLVWIDSGADPRLRWITAHRTQISKRFCDCMPADRGLAPIPAGVSSNLAGASALLNRGKRPRGPVVCGPRSSSAPNGTGDSVELGILSPEGWTPRPHGAAGCSCFSPGTASTV